MKDKKKKKKKIFFGIWEFLSQIWEKHLIFALGIGAEIRPQNRPRKIPVMGKEEIDNFFVQLGIFGFFFTEMFIE